MATKGQKWESYHKPIDPTDVDAIVHDAKVIFLRFNEHRRTIFGNKKYTQDVDELRHAASLWLIRLQAATTGYRCIPKRRKKKKSSRA